MHFHIPADTVSAIQYELHPNSWSVHPEAEYPAFPEAVFQEVPSFSVRRSDPSRLFPVRFP